MREVVKIASENHPTGYYTQWKDRMKLGDVIYQETALEPENKPAEEPSVKPAMKRKVKK
jgi:hypothetical protein